MIDRSVKMSKWLLLEIVTWNTHCQTTHLKGFILQGPDPKSTGSVERGVLHSAVPAAQTVSLKHWSFFTGFSVGFWCWHSSSPRGPFEHNCLALQGFLGWPNGGHQATLTGLQHATSMLVLCLLAFFFFFAAFCTIYYYASNLGKYTDIHFYYCTSKGSLYWSNE